MNYRSIISSLLPALVLAGLASAQSTGGPVIPPTPIFLQQSVTTGMVGFTTDQTARLNVLNLNSVPGTAVTTPNANCTVELQFFDAKNNMVKQTVVPNFAAGAATSLDLPRASVTSETTPRAEIRGVVVVNPSPSPVASPAAVGYCAVFSTLEIIDSTGSTVAMTSDTRPMGSLIVMPLIERDSR